MTYIPPNSVVEVFTDIGIDKNYSDSLYFPTTEFKDNYFTLLTNSSNFLGRYQSITYQREERNYVRVSASMSTLMSANYIRYKNTSYENKWFYAFVESVEYINNEVVQINYINDVLTTWMGGFELEECYIERMHSPTDNLGDNIIPETFTFNDYVINETGTIKPSGANEFQMVVVICYAFSGISEVQSGQFREGTFNGLGMKAYLPSDVNNINAFITRFSAFPDAIVTMYMCKEAALGIQVPYGGIEVPASSRSVFAETSVSQVTSAMTLDGYLPKNRKMYTFPFNFCCITNNQGNTLNAKYEYCENNTVQVRVNYSHLLPVSEMLRLVHYRGSGNFMDNFQTLTLEGYPLCNWSSDAYLGWVAENVVPYTVNAAVGTITSYFNPIAGASSLLGTAASLVKSQYDALKEPDTVRGNVANGSLLYSCGSLNFSFARMSLNAKVAEEIDKFFDMFGYAYNQLGQPSMNNRMYWTYLKTKGCKIRGRIPSDDCAEIERIIDNGVRFWKGVEYIGYYSSLDNYTLE